MGLRFATESRVDRSRRGVTLTWPELSSRFPQVRQRGMSLSILIFMVNISWGRWFVKSSLPWLIRFNAISPGFYFYFFFFSFFFPPTNHATNQPLLNTRRFFAARHPCRAQMGRTKLHSTGVTNSLPRPPGGRRRRGGGRWQRSRTFHSVNLPLSPSVKLFNGEFSNQATGSRNGFSTFWTRNSDWRRERTASQGGSCV